MSDDTSTTDAPEEPDADQPDDDAQDPHDADTSDDTPTDDDDVDPAELRTRLEEAEAEAARYKRRLLAADLRKKQVEKELRELRSTSRQPEKQDDDRQTGKQPDQEVERELADLRRQIQDQKVRTTFDGYNKYEWANPNAAYRLLDLDDVRQDDGTVDVDDLHDAVDRLAKDNGFLLKTAPTPKRGERPTGQQPGSHRREQKTDHSKTFRALRGRV